MSDFYMLAGTVLSHKSLDELQAILADHSISSQIQDDELILDGQATLAFRTGFEHEYILVGDASDYKQLAQAVQTLSTILCQQQLQHSLEIYDTNNELIQTLEKIF